MGDKFVTKPPGPQNAVDIFAGRWATNVGEIVPGVHSGGINAFREDDRPRLAAEALGRNGRFDGFRVLELGPLEGAHTFQLEQLGAESVDAIESNVDAFLKCLIVKELGGLSRSRFHLGDFTLFPSGSGRFDLIFCSGVLYHMAEPLRLIKLISESTGACFVWTHYIDDQRIPPGFSPRDAGHDGYHLKHYEMEYPNPNDDKFWGGNRRVACWLTKRDLFAAFEHYGLGDITLLRDESTSELPSITFAAKRRAG